MVTQEERQRWQRDARKSWRGTHQPKQGITLTSHANAIAARIMQHFPLHRIVILFFIAIFIGSLFHAQSADAKASFISSSGFQTDNFVRLDMATANGVQIDAQVDNTGFCEQPNRAWVDSNDIPASPQADASCQAIPTSIEAVIATHFFRYQSITAGTLGGVNAPEHWFIGNSTLNATANGNFTDAWNLTFSREYPITNFQATIATSGTVDGTGTITTWFQARDSFQAVVRQWEGPSQPCDVPSVANANNVGVAFIEAQIRTITVSINTSQCNYSSNLIRMAWWDFGAWNLGNKTASLEFAMAGIDYADYLVKSGGLRTLDNAAAGQGNYSNCVNCTYGATGASAYYFYGARACSTGACSTPGEGGCAMPFAYQFGGGVKFLGTAVSGLSGLCIFKMLADAGTSSVFGRINGTFSNGHITFWYDEDAKFWFLGGAGGFCGGAPLGAGSLNLTGCESSLLARGFNLYANLKNNAGLKVNTFDGVALVIPDGGPALGTVSQDAALVDMTLSAAEPTERLVETQTASKFAKGRQTFTVTLNPSTYFGNAIYFTLAATNATATPEICTNTQNVAVNGNPARLSWTRSGREPTLVGVPFARVCAWLIDDFVRTSGVRDADNNGNWLFLDNGRSAGLRTYAIEITDWPDENANGGNGHPLRFVNGFWARHSSRIACNKDLIACFGNLDTSGVRLPVATPTKWVIQAIDASTGITLPGIRVQETVTGVGNVTQNTSFSPSATGFFLSPSPIANITTSSFDFRFVFTASNFKTLYVNFTEAFNTVYSLSVRLNQSAGLTSFRNCIFINVTADSVICPVVATANSAEACQLWSIARNQCLVINTGLGALAKKWFFACPVDGSSGKALSRVNITEFVTGVGFQTPFAVGGSACPDTLVLNMQTNTVQLAFNQPGYRYLLFNATWLTADTVKIFTSLKLGTEVREAVVSAIQNSTISDVDGIRNFTLLSIEDPGTPTKSVLDAVNAGRLDIVIGLPNLCDAMGLRDEAGHAICGIGALITIIFAMGGMWYVAFQQTPPGSVAGLVGMVSFLGLSWIGLFPFWLVLIVVLFIIALILLPFIRGTNGGT